ncbi:MAG: CRISPR-associated protein Cas5t [Thermotogota bacterium]|nr:CRISPR-associated protein Cas5t [Thermotogota bacterium]MDK2865565.1 CRISPR-associated protein Cas5t [Thermotogota bacterium]
MKALKVDLHAHTASFRHWDGHLLQRTYIFPPKTTVIGMLGAALGYELHETWDFLGNTKIGMVLKRIGGTARDLWKIVKLKTSELQKAVVLREFLFDVTYTFYLVDTDMVLEKLKTSLVTPRYPLTLGNSNDLVTFLKTKTVEIYKMPVETVESTILSGDFRNSLEPLQKHSEIIVDTLPTRSLFDKKGRRIGTEHTKLFTCLLGRYRLLTPEELWVNGGDAFELL